MDRQGYYIGTRNAVKIAGHELRYLNEIYQSNVTQIHIPLMCLIGILFFFSFQSHF
jgi:hypothetical protein